MGTHIKTTKNVPFGLWQTAGVMHTPNLFSKRCIKVYMTYLMNNVRNLVQIDEQQSNNIYVCNIHISSSHQWCSLCFEASSTGITAQFPQYLRDRIKTHSIYYVSHQMKCYLINLYSYQYIEIDCYVCKNLWKSQIALVETCTLWLPRNHWLYM